MSTGSKSTTVPSSAFPFRQRMVFGRWNRQEVFRAVLFFSMLVRSLCRPHQMLFPSNMNNTLARVVTSFCLVQKNPVAQWMLCSRNAGLLHPLFCTAWSLVDSSESAVVWELHSSLMCGDNKESTSGCLYLGGRKACLSVQRQSCLPKIRTPAELTVGYLFFTSVCVCLVLFQNLTAPTLLLNWCQ